MLQQFTMFDIGIDTNSAKFNAQAELQQQQNQTTAEREAEAFF